MKSIKTVAVAACALVALAVGVSSATAGSPPKTTPLAYETKTGTCDATPGAPKGAVSISNNVAKLTVPEQLSWAQIRTNPGGLQLKDITRLTFKSNADTAGVVYMKVNTEDVLGGTHSVLYSP